MTILVHYNSRQKWQKKTELTSTLTKLLGNVTPETIAGTCHYTNFGSRHFPCYVWNMSAIWKNISERREVEQGKTCFDRKTRIMNKKQCTERMTSEQELVGIKQWTLFVCTVVLLAAWESIKIGKWDICKINSDWGSAPLVGWFGIKLLSSPGTIMTG